MSLSHHHQNQLHLLQAGLPALIRGLAGAATRDRPPATLDVTR